MKRILFQTIGLILLLLLFFNSCQINVYINPVPALTDGLGRKIVLEKPAQRIVSLAPPNTEILFAVGGGEQLVGRDAFSDYPPEAKNIQDIGGSYGKYDLEKIVSLEPDLILAGEINTPEQVNALEKLGLKVFYLKNPLDLGGMYAMILTIGRLSGHESSAKELINSLKGRAEEIVNKLSGITTHPTVFYELDASDPAKPYTPGPGTFYTNLISLAGAENIGAKLSSAWAQISLEQLLVENPYFIILGDAMFSVTPESVASRAGWQSLSAVKEGRVLPFDDNLLVRYGPRQVDGLEALAKIFHPEAFR